MLSVVCSLTAYVSGDVGPLRPPCQILDSFTPTSVQLAEARSSEESDIGAVDQLSQPKFSNTSLVASDLFST